MTTHWLPLVTPSTSCTSNPTFIEKPSSVKYIHRSEITNRATQEKSFPEKFEALNRVRLTDADFARLLEETIKRSKQQTKRVQPSVFLSLN